MSSGPPAFSDDGTLRYLYVSGGPTGDRYDSVAVWVTLHDAATGALLFDGERWHYSTVRPQADGSLFLHLSQSGRDTLFRIDPRAHSFRDVGAQGADRPLVELGAAASAALDAAFAPTPWYRAISPDGTIRVDRESVEWGNTLWVYSPRVTDLAQGRILLDLWGSDWDASASFPADRQVQLALRRFHHGGAVTVLLDLERETYRVVAEPGHDGAQPEAPLAGIVPAIEAAAQRSIAFAVPRGFARSGPPPRPDPWAAWRAAVLILTGALIAIAVATILTLRFSPPPKQQLTPLPEMPGRR